MINYKSKVDQARNYLQQSIMTILKSLIFLIFLTTLTKSQTPCSYCADPVVKLLYVVFASERYPVTDSPYRTSLTGGSVSIVANLNCA